MFSIVSSFPLAARGNAQDQGGILKDIILFRGKEKLEIHILLSTECTPRLFELQSPPRLALDLDGIQGIAADRRIAVGGYGIRQIRAGLFTSRVTRIVFDMAEKAPLYEIGRIPGGIKIAFWLPEEKRKEEKPKELMEKVAEKAEEEKIEKPEKPEKKEEQPVKETGMEKGKVAKKEESAQDASQKTDKKPEEMKGKPGETVTVLSGAKGDQLRQPKKFIRVTATASYFSPREGVLKEVYRHGMMFGGEVNVGIAEYVDIWLGGYYFGKTVLEAASEQERKVWLLPVEAGFKFRLNNDFFNPYFGIGAGYFQYREQGPLGEVRESQIGFIGQAGFFFKIGGLVIIDGYAQYKYYPIERGTERFDVGGFNFGGGFGFEF